MCLCKFAVHVRQPVVLYRDRPDSPGQNSATIPPPQPMNAHHFVQPWLSHVPTQFGWFCSWKAPGPPKLRLGRYADHPSGEQEETSMSEWLKEHLEVWTQIGRAHV